MGLLVLCTFDACMRSHLAKQLVAYKGVSAHRLIFGFVGLGPFVDAIDDICSTVVGLECPWQKKKGEIAFGCTLIWCTAQCGRAQRAFH